MTPSTCAAWSSMASMAPAASGVVFNSGAQLQYRATVWSRAFSRRHYVCSRHRQRQHGATVHGGHDRHSSTATGLWIVPTGGVAANVSLRNLNIDWNTGNGLRVDGTAGTGAVIVAIADSSTSFNASNGIDAISGPGSVTVTPRASSCQAMALTAFCPIRATAARRPSPSAARCWTTMPSAPRRWAAASLLSYSNNQMNGNATNGSFTGPTPLQ